MAKRTLAALLGAPLALVGCSDSSSDAPTHVTKVVSGGFTSPTDAVASPDGKTFYFAAFDELKSPTIYKVSSAPGSAPEVLATADPLEMPTGLLLSCDGSTLYIADIGGDAGGIYSLSTSAGGTVANLGTTNIIRPTSLAMRSDCSTIHAAGRTEDGKPALFSLPTIGGAATLIYQGEPLVSPTGMYVDNDGVSWLLDHRAAGANGEGVLWAIPVDGREAKEVASNLRMGTVGGCSLTMGGGTAVVPTRDRDGNAQLTSIDIKSGDMNNAAIPEMTDPSGLRTARDASVFAVVDSEANTIFRAE